MKKQIPVMISSVLAVLLIACGAVLLHMRNEQSSLQQQAAQLQAQTEQQTAQIQTLRQEAEASAAEKEAEINALVAEIAEKTTELDALTADAAEKAAQIDALNAAIAGKATEMDALAADMAGKTTEIDSLNADMAGKASTIAALTAEIDALQADLTEKEAALETIEASLAESAAQLDALNAETAEKTETIRALQEKTERQSADLTAREQEISDLQAELSRKAAETAEKTKEISQLQGIIHDSAAVAQRNALYDQLTAAGITPCVEIAAQEVFSTEQAASEGVYILTREYTWENAWSHYWALSFRNVSGATKAFRVQVVLYDAAGNVIGIKNPCFDCLADGYEGMVYISNDQPFDHVSFTVTVEESGSQAVQPFVEVTAQKSGNKAIITARNNGDTAARYVEYTALFLKGGEAVDSAWGYLTDGDNEIKPGKTELREEIRYPDFDSVAIFFEGIQ